MGEADESKDVDDLPEEAGNGVDHGNDSKTENGTKALLNGSDKEVKTVKLQNIGNLAVKELCNFGGPYGWTEWLGQNKFSMLSMTAAGLAMSVAGVSRDMRVKL